MSGAACSVPRHPVSIGAFGEGTNPTDQSLSRLISRSGAPAYNPALLAGVAQLVEQLIRNEKVGGSIPSSGTIEINNLAPFARRGFVVSEAITDFLQTTVQANRRQARPIRHRKSLGAKRASL